MYWIVLSCLKVERHYQIAINGILLHQNQLLQQGMLIPVAKKNAVCLWVVKVHNLFCLCLLYFHNSSYSCSKFGVAQIQEAIWNFVLFQCAQQNYYCHCLLLQDWCFCLFTVSSMSSLSEIAEGKTSVLAAETQHHSIAQLQRQYSHCSLSEFLVSFL